MNQCEKTLAGINYPLRIVRVKLHADFEIVQIIRHYKDIMRIDTTRYWTLNFGSSSPNTGSISQASVAKLIVLKSLAVITQPLVNDARSVLVGFHWIQRQDSDRQHGGIRFHHPLRWLSSFFIDHVTNSHEVLTSKLIPCGMLRRRPGCGATRPLTTENGGNDQSGCHPDHSTIILSYLFMFDIL